jgi:glycogen synthase
VEGKQAARRRLQERLNLARSDKLMIGVVSRLTPQKGARPAAAGWEALAGAGGAGPEAAGWP